MVSLPLVGNFLLWVRSHLHPANAVGERLVGRPRRGRSMLGDCMMVAMVMRMLITMLMSIVLLYRPIHA